MSTIAELPGWTRRVSRRKSGYSAGRSNVYYYSPNGMKFRSKPEISRTLGNNIDLAKFDFKARNRVEDTPTNSHLITRRSPPKDLDFRKVVSLPLTKVRNRTTSVKSPRRSPRNTPREESPKSPLSSLSPSLKKASMMKPLRQTCGVMRLPIEYVRPDHTNSDDIMPEKLLQNGLFQGHWDNRLKSFYPVDGNTGEVMVPPAPNPIQASIIVQPTPIQADAIQAQVMPTQTNSLPAAPILNKIASPPISGPTIFQPTKIHHPTQSVPFSLNLIPSGLAPNLLSNTNHNLSPATVNQLHALLLKSPAKTEHELPQVQPNCTTLQQPRLPKPIPSKPTVISQNKPPSNSLFILQTQVPQNIPVGIGQRGQNHNFIQAPAPPSSGTNLIQIVSNQTPGKAAGNKVMSNNLNLSSQEVLLLNPNAIGNPNNSQQPHIKLTRPITSTPIINRPIIHQSTTTTTASSTTATPMNSQHQSDISQDTIRKQQLRIEQLKKQLLDAENTQTS